MDPWSRNVVQNWIFSWSNNKKNNFDQTLTLADVQKKGDLIPKSRAIKVTIDNTSESFHGELELPTYVRRIDFVSDVYPHEVLFYCVWKNYKKLEVKEADD